MVVVCPPEHPLTKLRRGDGRTASGLGFRRLRPRPEHPQGDRSPPAAARGEHPDGDGVRQHRDHQAGGADRRRREHPARADGPRRGSRRLVGGRAVDRARAAPADRHHPPPAASVHAHARRSSSSSCSKFKTIRRRNTDARHGSPRLLPAVGQGSLCAARHPAGRGGGRGRPGGGDSLRRRRALRPMPGDRHLRRRRADGRRTPLAFGRGTARRAGGWPANRRCAGRRRSRFRPLRGLPPSTRFSSTPHGADRGRPTIRPCENATSSFRRPSAATICPTLLRLERALDAGPLEIDLPLLRELPARLREADFRGTAVLAERRLLDFEPGNTEADAFAVAVDVGTTTLVATLLDLGTGSEWAVDARLNPQTRFGDDVLSRILYARQDPDGLRQLQEAIVAGDRRDDRRVVPAGGHSPRADLRSHLCRQHHHAAIALRHRYQCRWARCRSRRPRAGPLAFPAARARAAHPSRAAVPT